MKKQSRFKISRRSRNLYCDFGNDCTSPRFYSSSEGSYYSNNYRYIDRQNQDKCLAFFNTAKLKSNGLSNWLDFHGVEEIVSKSGNRTGMNNCVHRKLRTVNYPFLIVHRHYSIANAYTIWDYLRLSSNRGLALYLGQLIDENKLRYDVGLDSGFSSRAFWSMRPKFVGEVSIVNSIFELKDFRDFVKVRKNVNNLRNALTSPLMSKYAKAFKDLARDKNIKARLSERGISSYYDLTPDVLGALARDGSGTAATAVLTMNLAIKPTIADVLGIMAQCATSAEQAQNTFAQYGQIGTSSHFSEGGSDNSLTAGVGTYNFSSTGRSFTYKRTATMRSKYVYVPRSSNEALRRYWGLTGSAEALWNMLPLGFVLDYVFTVGKALSYMDRDNNVQNLTTEYCESVKLTASDGIFVRQDPAVAALVVNGVYHPKTSGEKFHLVSGTQCTRYTRKVMEPYKGPALPKFKLPSTSQAGNMLALARCFVN